MSDKAVPATKSTSPGGEPRWKLWHSRSRYILMLLAAAGIIIYLLRSGLYAGLGAALCVIACGLFLIWHTIHMFVEQDKVEGQNEDAALSTRQNSADNETTSAAPSESGQNLK